MEPLEVLIEKLTELCEPRAREQLLAKGLARSMIWRDGRLPEDSPRFGALLTNDLLNHGYLVLGCSLRLREQLDVAEASLTSLLNDGFRTAAECIEAAVRHGQRQSDRGFHLTIAAASYHLGQFGARSYSLLAEESAELNLASSELLLVALMRRRLDKLQEICNDWLNDPEHSDAGVAAALENADKDFDVSDAAYTAACRHFFRGIAFFEYALRTGDPENVSTCLELLDECIDAAQSLKHVPLWWAVILARHLIDELWGRCLHVRLPTPFDGGGNWPDLRRNFIELLTQRSVAEVDLWPSQLEAATRVVDEEDSLVVALPTSSGKTRIAELCILRCLAGGRRVIYVTPLRALSAQVEGTLSRTFRPLGFSVSSVYGASGLGASDVETMRSASVVVATPEKLDFAIRQDAGVIDDVGLIVLDEGHMIGLSEREIRYEILVQRLLRRPDARSRRIVCLSAIFSDGDAFDAFTKWIRDDRVGAAIRSSWRPTRQRPATVEWLPGGGRLEYSVAGEKVFIPRFIAEQSPRGKRKKSCPQDKQELVVVTVDRFHNEGHSVLVYCPTRKSVEPTAETFLKLLRQGYLESYLREGDEEAIQAALRIGEEWLGADHVAMQALRVGVAVHHGSLPRPFLSEIESLLRRRILSVAISSPTLAQGVDLSFGVLVFTSLWRNGSLIPAKEFANVIGRVGRAFVDLDGIFALPVFDKAAGKRRKRLAEFATAVKQARGRQLESGLYLMIDLCLRALQEKLGEGVSMVEYVLNQQGAIDALAASEDEDLEGLDLILADFDAGLLALVDDLECDVSEVAAVLDEALQSSLWKRRIATKKLSEQLQQQSMIVGRARHIWSRTDSAQRRGFFAASIGTESGLQLTHQSEDLRLLLTEASEALSLGDSEALGKSCTGLAERLYEVHPFKPKLPSGWDAETWKAVLSAWIRGTRMSQATDAAGIAFVQDAIVYRLVWAIEAVRIVLASLDGVAEKELAEDETSYVALCVTYGVPSISAARMLECGLESRLLAVRIATELRLAFRTRDELFDWLWSLGADAPVDLSESEQAVWEAFTAKNDRSYESWHRNSETVSCNLHEDFRIDDDMPVRLLPGEEGTVDIFSAEFAHLGSCDWELPEGRTLVGTLSRGGDVTVSWFGPFMMPRWMRELLE